MFCDVRLPGGEAFCGDSRAALLRALRQAAALGYTMQVGSEIEFFLFAPLGENGAAPLALDDGAYFDLTPLDVGSDFRRRTIDYLEQMGIPVKASHHEVAPSQHEIQLAHSDALAMADAVTTFRLAVKEVAHELGAYATFMPKPLAAHPGSGMHLHVSLFAGERNAFHDPDPDVPLSPTGRAFLAGVLAHAPELTAVTNQWVNSYRRLASGFEAPERVGWTRRGDATLVRVPSRRPGRASATRFELRSPDPSCNPYAALTLVLAAGLRGIERGYELAAESDGPAPGDAALPRDLREATDLFDASDLAREALGDRFCDAFVANKRREVEDERRTVTDFDRSRYLRLL
jgi:glutamine synthetase